MAIAPQPEIDVNILFESNERIQKKIAREFLNGLNREEIVEKFFPLVGKQEPFIFKMNAGGRREPKPWLDQRRIYGSIVSKTLKTLRDAGFVYICPAIEDVHWTSAANENKSWRTRWYETKAKELKLPPYDRVEPEPPPTFFTPSPEPVDIPASGTVSPVVKKPPKVLTAAELIDEYYERLMMARSFVLERAIGKDQMDFISTRAVKDGANAVAQGIHPDIVMNAVTRTWPDDAKAALKDYDKIWEPKESDIDYSQFPIPASMDGAHEALGYVMILAKAGIPIYLVGPTGSGKSYLARALADALADENDDLNEENFGYGECPMTNGATPSWLAGSWTIEGYIGRPFVDCFEGGGVFCFEEMDAADPNLLLLTNNALANEWFFNPVSGEYLERSEWFIPVATANTYGLGATRHHKAREGLDAATLDRWRVGRVEVDYDPEVERNILEEAKLKIPRARVSRTKRKQAATSVKKKTTTVTKAKVARS